MQNNKLRISLFVLWYIIWALVIVFFINNKSESNGNHVIVLSFLILSIFIRPLIDKLAPKKKEKKEKMKSKLKEYMYILAVLPIEYLAIVTDYYTSTMWGYIPFLLLVAIAFMYAGTYTKLTILSLTRLLGGIIAYILIYLSSERLITTGYFKPVETSEFSIILSVVSLVVIIMVYTYKKVGLK
ncbi:hypothetical protein OXR01_09210 [Staphylococcus gallinarum]|uniref:hypothetical protein n=1 Tax=Staphylococcus gallinarum TaxID=1293 RepID=UPI0022830BE7|nr:hypothetical protein [Staphylococcus gallinarum]MDN6414117.1 hypothetical protein [Staphylococcus gallinarum]